MSGGTRDHLAPRHPAGRGCGERRGVQRAAGQAAPEGGEIPNHGKYESIKADLGSLGLARGYFDAKISKSQVKVFPEQGKAEIYILFRSGPRYHFGEIRYDATPEALHLIRPLINIKSGDPYLAIRLAEMSQDVSSTKLFKQVDIKPLISQAEGNRVPVQVTLSNRVDHEIETGIGYATDVGPRLSATWEKPWVNRYGHRLSSTAKISAPEAELSFDYQIPVGNPLRDYYPCRRAINTPTTTTPAPIWPPSGAPLDTPTGELGQRRLCAPGERALRPGSGRGEQPAADPRRLLVTAAGARRSGAGLGIASN